MLFNDAWSQKGHSTSNTSYTRIRLFITSITITYYHHFHDHVLTFISITNLLYFLIQVYFFEEGKNMGTERVHVCERRRKWEDRIEVKIVAMEECVSRKVKEMQKAVDCLAKEGRRHEERVEGWLMYIIQALPEEKVGQSEEGERDEMEGMSIREFEEWLERKTREMRRAKRTAGKQGKIWWKVEEEIAEGKGRTIRYSGGVGWGGGGA